MNILVVTNMYPTQDRPAYGVFVQEQVEDVRALGATVHVMTIDGRARRSEYARGMVKVRSLVARSSYDVVHAHYGLSGAVALAQRRVPVVTTFHGSDLGPVRWQHFVSWLVARAVTPIVVAPYGRVRLGRPDACIIPCGVDTNIFVPLPRQEARRRLGWAVDGCYALLPGSRSNPVKRPDLFSAAVAEARAFVPQLRETALENLSREQVSLVMNAVDVTVVTSDSEGAPVAVKESLAVGTPVVSVDVGDVPEVISGLPGCAVVERAPAAIGASIVAALDESRRDELRARVLPFSRSAIAADLMSVYDKVKRRRSSCQRVR